MNDPVSEMSVVVATLAVAAMMPRCEAGCPDARLFRYIRAYKQVRGSGIRSQAFE